MSGRRGRLGPRADLPAKYNRPMIFLETHENGFISFQITRLKMNF
jgi:hypothetical protein